MVLALDVGVDVDVDFDMGRFGAGGLEGVPSSIGLSGSSAEGVLIPDRNLILSASNGCLWVLFVCGGPPNRELGLAAWRRSTFFLNLPARLLRLTNEMQ